MLGKHELCWLHRHFIEALCLQRWTLPVLDFPVSRSIDVSAWFLACELHSCTPRGFQEQFQDFLTGKDLKIVDDSRGHMCALRILSAT